MTKEEYKEAQKQLSQKYEADKMELAKQYAADNNPYGVGDVLTDHCRTIRVEKMQFNFSTTDPQLVYIGVWLKKDGTPNKKGEKDSVYQSNIVESKTCSETQLK